MAGVDVVDGGRVEVDLSEDLTVTVTDPEMAARADEVELAMGPVGLPINNISGSLQSGQAVIDPGITQRTIAGYASATVTLRGDDAVLGEQDFGVDATQTWYLTVPFVVGVLLVLLALANLESSLKPLRSGHPRLLSTIGASISGACSAPRRWCSPEPSVSRSPPSPPVRPLPPLAPSVASPPPGHASAWPSGIACAAR